MGMVAGKCARTCSINDVFVKRVSDEFMNACPKPRKLVPMQKYVDVLVVMLKVPSETCAMSSFVVVDSALANFASLV